MRLLKLLLVMLAAAWGLAACADPNKGLGDRFSAWLQARIGEPEAQLIQRMQRIPDGTHPLDADTKIMQWKLPTNPSGTPEICYVEWMVTKGVAASFTMRGRGCPP